MTAYPALASVPSWQPGRMHCYYPDKVARPNSTWSFGDVGGEVRSANGYLAHYRTGPLELATAISEVAERARAVYPSPRTCFGPHARTRSRNWTFLASTGPSLRLPARAEATRQVPRRRSRTTASDACPGRESMGRPPDVERTHT